MGEATALTVVRSTDHLTGAAGRATSVTRDDRARRAPGQVGALTISNLRIMTAPANRKALIQAPETEPALDLFVGFASNPAPPRRGSRQLFLSPLGALPRSSRREFVVPHPLNMVE